MPNGVLLPNQVISRNLTFINPSNARLSFRSGLIANEYPNSAPEFISQPPSEAVAGDLFEYQALATDPDGGVLNYLLLSGPQGMTLDRSSGLVSWQPTSTNRVTNSVILQAYDSRGGSATQRFTITLSGGNHAPEFAPLPAVITGSEGTPLEVAATVTDVDQDQLRITVENMPPEPCLTQQHEY